MGKRTGIIFNNEMDDFSLPNSRVSYGVNNLIEPGSILLMDKNGCEIKKPYNEHYNGVHSRIP